MKKYDWNPDEMKVAELAKSKGWVVMRTVERKDKYYTLYDDMDLIGAFTINNLLVESYKLKDIEDYLNRKSNG